MAKECSASFRLDPETVATTLDPTEKSAELKLRVFAKKDVKITRSGRWLRPRPSIRFDYSTSRAEGSKVTLVEFHEQ